jgi:murein DD-endopeptidase MepM/ murein hydrolase activator NlpD
MQVIFGPRPDFYGNVVVIEHDYLAPDGRPIYSLYGHLSRVDVTAGQRGDFGQTIAAVGATGVAFGPHLHLEIRLGTPLDYYSTYNPELWVTPYENHGVLAARILGPDGTPIKGLRVELIGRGSFLSGWTYETDTVNSDPYFQENLVIGDIRAGQYDLKVGEIRNILYRDVVFIEASVVNLIEIRLPSVPLGEGS